MSDLPDNDDELKARFNRETSKISWQELQKHYARGVVIAVANGIDLIDVACQFSRDNTQAVERWLSAGAIYKVDDQQAATWLKHDSIHWAVVVAPWVLVQEMDKQ